MVPVIVLLVSCFDLKIYSTEYKAAIKTAIPTAITPTVTPANTPIPTNTPTPEPTKDPYADMPKYQIKLNEELQKYLWDKCKENNWPYELVLSQLKVESDFDIALIHKNDDGSTDRGLAQINSSTLKFYQEKIPGFDPYNPYHAIQACILYLNENRIYWVNKGITDQEQIIVLSLNSYNMGLPRYLKYRKNTGATSRGYDRTINKYRSQLKNIGTFKE
jgi:soluble lytic murein transglycosylase-like protein